MIEISEDVRKKLPGVKVGYAIVKGVNVKKTDSEVERLKRLTLDIVNREHSLIPNSPGYIKENPKLASWREVYKGFGFDTGSRVCSSEALIKRILKGGKIPKINTLVDAYNISSIRKLNPMAAYDLDKVNGKVELRYSEGENFRPILSDDTTTQKGEIVYADDEKVICSGYNYRDSDFTKITEETKNVLVITDGTDAYSEQEVLEALSTAVYLIQRFCDGECVEKKVIV